MLYLSNAHTHTTFCDGRSTAEEMVQKALSLGFTSLGFSGHSYLDYEKADDQWTMVPAKEAAYIQELHRLQDVYQDKIKLYLGIELDSYSSIDLTPYDYYIGSVHTAVDPATNEHLAYDNTIEEYLRLYQEVFQSDPIRLAEHYYQQVVEHMQKTKAPILGHFNLITKYNKKLQLINEEDPAYKAIAGEALLEAAKHARCVEINTGAIGRGHADIPYPNQWMMDLMHENHIPVILTCDCHDAEKLGVGYDVALEMLKKAGYTSLLTLGQNELFEEIPLC